MSLDDLIAAKTFSYRTTKDGLVRISFKGRIVTTLRGTDASRFLKKVDSAGSRDVQLAMAKATGHFKHGSERRSSSRRRDP